MPHSPQDVHKKVLGKKGETLAEKYLKKQGYKILFKNYKTPLGEADIVAEKEEYVVFVEVKTRTGDGYGTPAESVTKAKQARYKKIAAYYVSALKEDVCVRFDVVEVFADGKIEHLENAF
ncbi:MAG: YraN family protein [Clostridia bacterium]|nr:YraN family protein [Clostridia bacterium]